MIGIGDIVFLIFLFILRWCWKFLTGRVWVKMCRSRNFKERDDTTLYMYTSYIRHIIISFFFCRDIHSLCSKVVKQVLICFRFNGQFHAEVLVNLHNLFLEEREWWCLKTPVGIFFNFVDCIVFLFLLILNLYLRHYDNSFFTYLPTGHTQQNTF